MTPEEDKARADFVHASKVVAAAKAGKGDGGENAYAAAFQRLVRLGLVQQIKAKYR